MYAEYEDGYETYESKKGNVDMKRKYIIESIECYEVTIDVPEDFSDCKCELIAYEKWIDSVNDPDYWRNNIVEVKGE